jgi:cellulose synthase/poly-beta-1,6-N-acetylglucosamine synthase-like glycosyltransferase
MDVWLVVYLSLAFLVFLGSALIALQTWEHCRFVRSRIQNIQQPGPTGRVAVYAPCKGIDPGLADNLRPLFEQDHGNYQLLFIVESGSDPACETIRHLIAEYPRIDARLIEAGIANDCGQKVHNLRAATAELDPKVEYLAFVDSDARTHRQWLRRLVQHLHVPGSIASTGYRWMVPSRANFANHLLYSMNCAIASLIGPASHRMVWGGSWAIRRDVFDAARLHQRWSGTLSDDLVASQVLKEHGGHVEFEASCVLASPIDFDMAGMIKFVRRQYTIGRFYASRAWAMALVTAAVTQLVFWSGVVLAAVGVARQTDWAWIPITLSTIFYLMYVYRAALRQDASRYFLPEYQPALGTARRFDVWFNPVAGLCSCAVLASTALNRRIVWRGNVYEMFAGGRIRLLGRQPEASGQTVSAAGQAERQHSYRKAG